MKSLWREAAEAVVYVLVGIVFALLTIKPVCAETWLTGPALSYHGDRSQHYNERNLGAGLEQRLSLDWRAGAGFYHNSFYRTTLHAEGIYTPVHLGSVDLGAMLGLATGYLHHPALVLVPVAAMEQGRYGLNIVAIPRIAHYPGFLAVQFKVRY